MKGMMILRIGFVVVIPSPSPIEEKLSDFFSFPFFIIIIVADLTHETKKEKKREKVKWWIILSLPSFISGDGKEARQKTSRI